MHVLMNMRSSCDQKLIPGSSSRSGPELYAMLILLGCWVLLRLMPVVDILTSNEICVMDLVQQERCILE